MTSLDATVRIIESGFALRNGAWKKANRDRVAAEKLQYARNHPDQVAQWARTRKAAKRGVRECFTAAMKLRVIEQFEGRCFKCGSSIDLTLDHHLPLTRGFALEYGNAVVLCRLCNISKSDRPLHEFYTESERKELVGILMQQIALF